MCRITQKRFGFPEKKKKTAEQPSVRPGPGPGGRAPLPDPAGSDEDSTSDSENEDTGELPPNPEDPSVVKCRLGEVTVFWKIQHEGVPMCPRASTIDGRRKAKVMWESGPTPDQDRTVEETINWAFPMDWFLSEEGALGCTNRALPSSVVKFSEHEFVQCLGIITAKCLVGGPIRDLWKKRDTGFLPPLCVNERFGISRNRYEDWRRYLRFCDFTIATGQADKILPVIDAWNDQRLHNYEPGDRIILDESMCQWEQFFEYGPNSMEFQKCIARKPVPKGAELKTAACAETGFLLKLELQLGKVAMSKMPYCDK